MYRGVLTIATTEYRELWISLLLYHIIPASSKRSNRRLVIALQSLGYQTVTHSHISLTVNLRVDVTTTIYVVVSDEALVLIIIEHSYHRCISIHIFLSLEA